MNWFYPVSVDNILNWYDNPSGYGYAAALGVGDSEFIYTPAGLLTNAILIEMGGDCGLCELRARRGMGQNNAASLTVTFYDASLTQSQQWVIDLSSYPNWSDFSFTPSFSWRYANFEGQSIDVLVGVSLLRGLEVGGLPRRLLTGVGL